MSQPRFIPGDMPTYQLRPDGLQLLGVLSRPVTPTCDHCGLQIPLKLVADELLTPEECDELLDGYLQSLGWLVTGDDFCPRCAEEMLVRAEGGE